MLYGTIWATDSSWVGRARNLLGGVQVYSGDMGPSNGIPVGPASDIFYRCLLPLSITLNYLNDARPAK